MTTFDRWLTSDEHIEAPADEIVAVCPTCSKPFEDHLEVQAIDGQGNDYPTFLCAGPFERNGWICQIFPSPDRHNRVKFHARNIAHDQCVVNVELLPGSADDFDPDQYWGMRP
jgi:hypothetical protein